MSEAIFTPMPKITITWDGGDVVDVLEVPESELPDYLGAGWTVQA